MIPVVVVVVAFVAIAGRDKTRAQHNGHMSQVRSFRGTWLGVWFGSVPLPGAVSTHLSLFLRKAFTDDHHPLLLVVG